MSGKGVVVLTLTAGFIVAAIAFWYHRAYPDAPQATVSIARPEPSFATPEHDPILGRLVNSGPMARPRDFFRVIERPTYRSVEEAGRSMDDGEVVLGFEVAGEFRAYPINYLNDHEMVREEIGGVPLLITW